MKLKYETADWSYRHFLFLPSWPYIHILKEQKSNAPSILAYTLHYNPGAGLQKYFP